MTYPYGRREKLKLLWEDACKSSNVQVSKASVVFEGSKRHCGEQVVKWLTQKEFLDPVDLFKLSLRLDFTLFGRVYKMMEKEKRVAESEEKLAFSEA